MFHAVRASVGSGLKTQVFASNRQRIISDPFLKYRLAVGVGNNLGRPMFRSDRFLTHAVGKAVPFSFIFPKCEKCVLCILLGPCMRVVDAQPLFYGYFLYFFICAIGVNSFVLCFN